MLKPEGQYHAIKFLMRVTFKCMIAYDSFSIVLVPVLASIIIVAETEGSLRLDRKREYNNAG